MRREETSSMETVDSRRRLYRRVCKFLKKKKTVRTNELLYNAKSVVSRAAILLCCVLGVRCYMLDQSNNEYEAAYNKIKEAEISTGSATPEDDMSLNAITDRYVVNVTECQQIRAYDTALSQDLDSLVLQMTEQDLQNASLVAANNEYYAALKQYSLRSELYDKYGYALYDTSGERNDITYDQLITAEKLMVDNNIDPNLIFAIIMTESEGHANASNKSSTAAGYGQILASTGKAVYEDVMKNGSGSFTYSMLYDGNTNIAICANYLNYLVANSNSIYEVIESYRGMKDKAYCTKLDYYLNLAGTSLTQLNKELYSGGTPEYHITTSVVKIPESTVILPGIYNSLLVTTNNNYGY